ncbi:PREDICTED: echinoderm microtubule-associated protein-like 2, partial [Gekko japonicus]|uniref:Echinoderm microtubule-associated protein-like 2 n=1 Tax=Gekko japonicus TaxID=146911 RepID=A0ABM1L3W4_GEKJA
MAQRMPGCGILYDTSLLLQFCNGECAPSLPPSLRQPFCFDHQPLGRTLSPPGTSPLLPERTGGARLRANSQGGARLPALPGSLPGHWESRAAPCIPPARLPTCPPPARSSDSARLQQRPSAASDWPARLGDAAAAAERVEGRERRPRQEDRPGWDGGARESRRRRAGNGNVGTPSPGHRATPGPAGGMTDDNLSGTSGMEVDDRISYLEQRLQLQEDEIQVLKAALADVLRRLTTCEENGLSLQKRGPSKVYQLLRGLPSRPSLSNGILPQRRGYSTSPSSPKRELLPPGKSKPKEASFNAEDGYVKMFLRGRPVPMFVPDAVVATYSLDAKLDLPHKKLKLNWVYGYRGRDCRSNLFLLPTGEIAYFVAAVAVLYNVEEQRQRHYLGHTDDIKCLAVHPDMVTIATGQVAGTSKDGKPLPPHVRVWDSVSLNTLHVLGPGPFDRAISCVGFSKSNGGGLLCAVDDSNDHVLSVWDWQKEQKLADVKCSNESVLAATFHPTEPMLLITCGKSHIHFWTLEGSSLSKRQGIFEKHEKPKYVLCVAFTENGDTVTGDSGGNLYIWGKGGNRICHAVPGAHEGGIFGLCVLRNGTIVTGGGRDRRVVLWGRDYQKLQENEVPEGFGPVRTIAEGKGDSLFVGTTRNSVLQGSLATGFSLLVQGHTEELWGLATHPCLDQFVTCGQDKQVHLWSVATHQPLWSKGIEDAARSAGFHPSGSVLVVGTVTGRWLVLDTETRDLVTIHTDGGEQISVVSFSPDGRYLALGSHDNFVYIYAVSEGGRKYGRIGRCS